MKLVLFVNVKVIFIFCFQYEMRFAGALKEKKGFVIKRVQEDGACLFRAVCKREKRFIQQIFSI